MCARHNYLFRQGDLDAALREATQSIPAKVSKVPVEQFLASTNEELVEHILAQVQVEPLQIHEDQMLMERHETEVDVSGDQDRTFSAGRSGEPFLVPGTEVVIFIPFTGDMKLWSLRPSAYGELPPWGDVLPRGVDHPEILVLKITRPHDAPLDEFEKERNDLLQRIRFFLEHQRKDLEAFNDGLSLQIQNAINGRRRRLTKQEALTDVLGIPLRRREGAPSFEPIQVKRKITKPLPRQKPAEKLQPGISDELYEDILKLIRHVGRTYETVPGAFAKLKEEELRSILLANLNAVYEGGATGETFRKKGKTDICIEEEDRAAFVAECAVWYGEKDLLKKVDQLLGYLTWRDCKAALVVFNKTVKGFTGLLTKAPNVLNTHRLLVKDLGQQKEGEWRYVFHSEEDEGQNVNVHLFLFNLFVK